MEYTFDDDAAGKADNVANRIDENGPYIGKIKQAEALVSAEKGTKGVRFIFEVPQGGTTRFDLWTEKADGERIFGFNQLMAVLQIVGVRSMRTASGKVERFVDGKLEEVEGEVYPELAGKELGIVFQKELITTQSGKDSYRMNPYLFFHPTSKLTASEIKEKKAKPEKFEKVVKSVKTKDSRIKKEAEPAQPSVAPAGDY